MELGHRKGPPGTRGGRDLPGSLDQTWAMRGGNEASDTWLRAQDKRVTETGLVIWGPRAGQAGLGEGATAQCPPTALPCLSPALLGPILPRPSMHSPKEWPQDTGRRQKLGLEPSPYVRRGRSSSLLRSSVQRRTCLGSPRGASNRKGAPPDTDSHRALATGQSPTPGQGPQRES